MKLSEDAITEFKKIWKQEFGEDLSDKCAPSQAEEFYQLFLLIAPSMNHD